jgi:hypothetical protein
MSFVAENLAGDIGSVCIHHHMALNRKYEAISSCIIDSPPIDYTSYNHSFTYVILLREYNVSRL